MTSPSGEHPTMETKPQECVWVCRLPSPLQRALLCLSYSQASKLLLSPLPQLPELGWGAVAMQGPSPVPSGCLPRGGTVGAALPPCACTRMELCHGFSPVAPAREGKSALHMPSFSLSPSLAGDRSTSGCSRAQVLATSSSRVMINPEQSHRARDV